MIKRLGIAEKRNSDQGLATHPALSCPRTRPCARAQSPPGRSGEVGWQARENAAKRKTHTHTHTHTHTM